MMMPGMDGAATIRELTEINPDIRIIATSGIDSKQGSRTRGRRRNGFFYQKPCTAELLLKSLKSLLSRDT